MGRSTFVASVVGAAMLLGAVAVPPAAADAYPLVPVPTPSVALPAAVDQPTHYDPQTQCDPTAKPGATALADLLVATYGPATTYISRACTSSTSEHFDGRAVDWMRSVRVPAEKQMADTFVNWLLAPAADGTPHEMARRLGIMYIIWDNRMIRMYDPARGWTDYRSCSDPNRGGPGLDTTCHRNHVHLSMSWDGAAKATSWWTGVAQTRPWCPAGGTAATPGPGTTAVVPDPAAVPGVVPVTPTTVLDTTSGGGSPMLGPCRVRVGRAVHPLAAAPGVIPAGAQSVVLRLDLASTAPAAVSVWSSGATARDGQVAVPMGSATAHVVVPLASDGTVGIETSQGALDVRATVVGYLAGGQPGVGPGAVAGDTDGAEADAAARPGKPRKVRAKAKRRSVKVRWKAPRSNGGAAIEHFTVLALKSKRKGASVAGSCTTGPAARSCKVRKLKKRRYWISVSVTNSAGTSWAARKKVRVRR